MDYPQSMNNKLNYTLLTFGSAAIVSFVYVTNIVLLFLGGGLICVMIANMVNTQAMAWYNLKSRDGNNENSKKTKDHDS